MDAVIGFTETLNEGVATTTWFTGALVVGMNAASPEYFAVMTCVPAARDEVDIDACPALRVTLPRLVLPSKKVTVPLGTADTPRTVAATVAVKVIACPAVDGLAEELRPTLFPPAFNRTATPENSPLDMTASCAPAPFTAAATIREGDAPAVNSTGAE